MSNELNKFYNTFITEWSEFRERLVYMNTCFCTNPKEIDEAVAMIEEKINDYRDNHYRGKDSKSINTKEIERGDW